MINLTIFKDRDSYVGFCCEGHAGYAESGMDIVCASVSTAVEWCVAYFNKYFSDNVKITVDELDARYELRCINSFMEADRQFEILYEFASSLHEQYPKYFTFDFLEV